MKPRHWFTLAGLFLLIALAVMGLFVTRDTGKPVSKKGPRQRLVDQKPIETARALAVMANDQDERRYAQQALRVADHEVDLAFSIAMRQAKEHPPKQTPEAAELYARVNRAQAQISADQSMIDELKKELSEAKAEKASELQQQFDLVQAQMELDQDELQDAQGDLVRSGADPLSRIQRQFARYKASQEDAANTQAQIFSKAQATLPMDTLVDQVVAWRQLQQKARPLQQAGDDAQSAVTTLKQQHDALENQGGSNAAGDTSKGASADNSASKTDTSRSVIAALHRLSDQQKDLSDLDKQIQDQQELGEIYGNWLLLVQWHQKAAVHGMILSGLQILLIVLVIYGFSRLIDRYFSELKAERMRLRTLRMIVRFAVQAIGVLLIFFVILGVPNQMPTILGLAGAGLTVALKDFIVAFFGWFALMGRNGLRVGDWVEINGVVGEVVEIGLLRTVLLETGNWTDAGHPTGRKVAFVNSFAIEGHYFNFSTSGQWLWDELQILVPSSQDPYAVIDAINKVVTSETEANARTAEGEWNRAMSGQRIQAVSAAPAINLRPTSGGVEVHIRYITRASERFATRTRLYQEIVRVLHSSGEPVQANPSRS
ncbi:MAG TPA: mechanosensitive ion channel domain-containing protein [Terriglobales bacterium]